MSRLLRFRIGGGAFDRWLSWLAGLLLLAVATTLVLLALPRLDLAWSVVLVLSVGGAWLVIVRLFPRL